MALVGVIGPTDAPPNVRPAANTIPLVATASAPATISAIATWVFMEDPAKAAIMVPSAALPVEDAEEAVPVIPAADASMAECTPWTAMVWVVGSSAVL